MAEINFIADWSPEYQDKVPKGYLVIKPIDKHYQKVGKFMNKLNDTQIKKGELKELHTKFGYYNNRTIDQNSLLWALYEIEANEQNAGMSGAL